MADTTPNSDLGELVAELRKLGSVLMREKPGIHLQYGPALTAVVDAVIAHQAELDALRIAEKLARSDVAALRDLYALANTVGGEWKVKAEALKKERDARYEQLRDVEVRLEEERLKNDKAEAEVAALRSTLHTIATAPRPTTAEQARFCAIAQRLAREALGLEPTE